MKKFTRQTSGNAPPANVNLDFCSSRREGRPLYLSQAATDLASTPPALFKTNRTFPVVLNLIEMEGGSRVRHPTPVGGSGRTPARAILL